MGTRSPAGRVIVAGLVLVSGACERRAGGEAGEAAAEAEVVLSVPAPDTTGSGLWAHVEAAQYAETWALWPGRDRLYPGQEPHGMLLTTYVNAAALGAITDAAGSMPAGAIIVKENYMPDSTLAAVTVMYKAAPGYDAEHRDWFWLKRNADGTFEMEGRGGMCASCHASRAENDYVFTGALTAQ